MTNPAPSNRLTKAIFAQGIGMIADRWNRDVAPSTSAVMAEWLDSHGCTGDEFIAGVKRAIAEDEWPPSAKRILDLARPEANAEARGAEAFLLVQRLGKYHPYGWQWDREEIERVCGEAARRAFDSIGGGQRLGEMTVDALPFVLRDFTKAFAEFSRELASRHTTVTLLGRGDAKRQLEGAPKARAIASAPQHPKGVTDG